MGKQTQHVESYNCSLMFHLRCSQRSCGVGCQYCRLVTEEKTHSLSEYNFLNLQANTNVKSQAGSDLLASLNLLVLLWSLFVVPTAVDVVSLPFSSCFSWKSPTLSRLWYHPPSQAGTTLLSNVSFARE